MEGLGDRNDTPIEVATSFAALLGMALYQNDVEMEDRVGYLVFECLIFINKLSTDLELG